MNRDTTRRERRTERAPARERAVDARPPSAGETPRRATTIDDWSASLAATPETLDAFDRAVGELRTQVAVASHTPAVQMKASGPGVGGDPQAVARAGFSGGGGALPFRDRIQAAFGRHDVSHVRSFGDAAAVSAGRRLGAHAYTSGDAVAFARAPDLHTAAHEAAHVVQQRAGVALPGGMGTRGDRHERHADRVADAVLRGESAEGLLDAYGGGARGGGRGVQALQLEAHDEHGKKDKLPGDPKFTLGIGGKDGASTEGTIESDKTTVSQLQRVDSPWLKPRYLILAPGPIRPSKTAPTAGVYLLLKPEIRYGKKSELNFGGSASGQTRVNVKVALTLRAGVSSVTGEGEKAAGVDASIYAGGVLEGDATCGVKGSGAGLQLAACKVIVKGYVPFGAEVRAMGGGPGAVSMKLEAKALSGELLEVTFDGFSVERGLEGFECKPGKDLQQVSEWLETAGHGAPEGESDARTCAVGSGDVANRAPKTDDHRHVVRPNETLARIATMKLGDASRAREIAALNGLRVAPGARLEAGTILKMPSRVRQR